MRSVQLLRHDAYTVQLHCPTVLLMLKSRLVIANQIREFCYSYDYSDYNYVTQIKGALFKTNLNQESNHPQSQIL